MVWYYVKHGKQQGPVDEAEFGNLARTGGIGSADLVWTADFGAEWRPAHSLTWLVFSENATPVTLLPPKLPRSAIEYASTDFRSATPNRELMSAARASLRGCWETAIGVSAVWGLYSFVLGVLTSVLESWYSAVVGLFNVAASGPIALGVAVFWLSVSRAGYGSFVQAFSGFRRFWTALAATLLIWLIALLWLLPFIVPGLVIYYFYLGVVEAPADNPLSESFLILLVLLGLIVVVLICIADFVIVSVSLSYSQVYYLLADNPDMGAMEATGRSKKIMAGNRWKLFCLGCRFIGWGILCVPTLGIGLLWLSPYMYVSFVKFYDDLRPV